jgi:EmrB/QacA subfamily drug resistance transporter
MSPAGASANKWLVLVAACLGLGMLMIDTFIVNVAFPAIGRDLDANLGAAQWTVSGYVLATAVLPIAMGRIGDVVGRRRVYVAGLVVFVVASLACGLAQSIEQLILFRVVQGVGGATMMPGTLSIIAQAFPPHQRGLAIGIWGGVSGLGLIAGPIIGGLLVNGDEWRWIFYVNLPVGIVALLLALLFVPESRDESAPRSIDYAGLLALSGGLLGIMLALTQGNEEGWMSAVVLGCIALGVVLLGAFVLIERRVQFPLIDLALFRNPTFVFACLSAGLFSAAVFGSQPFTSLYWQNFMGYSALEGGLAFLPATVLVAGLMPVSGILGQRLGHRLRLIIMAGSLSVALSFVFLLALEVTSGYADGFLPALLLRGLGIGLVMSASSYAVVSSMPPAKSGLASGTLTMSRNIGTAIGVALFGAIYLSSVGSSLDEELPATTPAAERARVEAAADHFVPAGQGEVRAASEQSIVDGYVTLASWGVVVAGFATVSAAFIRMRPVPVPRESPAPATAVPARSP